MQAGKLVKVLRTFQPEDWKSLKKVISSPWFVRGADQGRLRAYLEVLKAVHPNYDQLEETQVAAVVFEEAPSSGRLAKLNSKLMRLIEHCFVQQVTTSDEQGQLLRLAAEWRERGLHNLAEQYLQKAERQFSTRTDRTQSYYLQGRLLAEERGKLEAAQSPINLARHLQEEEQYLDQWYLLTKLEKTVWLLAQRIQVQTSVEGPLLAIEHLEPQIEALSSEEYPVHCLYRAAWHFLKAYPRADLSLFEALETTLIAHGHLIEASKRKALQTLLRIFATARYNQGEKVYLNFAFNLYKKDLEAGDLYFDKKIHPQTLLNLVTLGLRSGAFSWVRTLLENHEARVWGEARADQTVRFNRALLHFYERDTDTALDFLDDHYDNLYYRLAARRLEIMIYYEQRSVLLGPKIEAFKVYIYRHAQKEIPAKPKALNNNFIDLLRQIIHPSTLYNEKRIERLGQKIGDTAHLAEREWLLRQLEELR